ncbi:MAG: hypothetical protein CMG80_04275 [Marinobacter sp.]|nr:hypothetical protein [Marinobacter sp.]
MLEYNKEMMNEKPLKIFHSIIYDMSNMIDDLREKQVEYDLLVEENESLKQQLEELKKKRYFGNLTLYFLVTSLSICLALPPRM